MIVMVFQIATIVHQQLAIVIGILIEEDVSTLIGLFMEVQIRLGLYFLVIVPINLASAKQTSL